MVSEKAVTNANHMESYIQQYKNDELVQQNSSISQQGFRDSEPFIETN
jgi:hypothetical protein